MSYDLAVYTTRAASQAELHNLIVQGSELQVESTAGRSMTVVRGARRKFSFTVDGPDVVEAEDVPSDVAAVVLGARHLYSIAVEGTVRTEIPHAVRFARRLAQALDGAVLDQQTDDVWSRSQSRKVQKPAREERVATVDVAWYCLEDEMGPDAASLFIDAAQQLLPEALPRRFGEYEPLQGKLAETGPESFVGAWRNATSLLFTAGSAPCIGGYLSAGPGAQHRDGFWSMSLDFLADPIREPAWREALRTLFVRLADEFPAFYASAEVTTGHIWSGRSLWSDGDTEWRINPVRYREGWTGLPPRSPWWAWLGEPYAEYYPNLPAERTMQTKRGVLYSAADEPSGPSGLVPLAKWLPEDLFSRLAPNPHRQQPVPLVPATTLPTRLRSPQSK